MKKILLALLAGTLPAAALGQMSGPPMGAVDRFLAPPTNLDQQFLGTWALTWDDPANPACPCHGILTIEVQDDGTLKGYWPMPGGPAVLNGDLGFDQNAWAGRFAQSDDVDFPLKGHFRLEARGGRALTGSYQRDGTAIPYRWSASRQ
jgi:hypothetical protein